MPDFYLIYPIKAIGLYIKFLFCQWHCSIITFYWMMKQQTYLKKKQPLNKKPNTLKKSKQFLKLSTPDFTWKEFIKHHLFPQQHFQPCNRRIVLWTWWVMWMKTVICTTIFHLLTGTAQPHSTVNHSCGYSYLPFSQVQAVLSYL